jgi:hypothetical protein
MAAPLPAPATYSGGPPATSGDPTAVFGRRAVAAIIDFALLIVPAMLLLTSSFEYLAVDDLDRDPQEYCDDYIDELDGFCVDMSEVDDRVYFAEDLGTGSAAVFWLGGFALLVVLQGLTGWTPGKLVMGVRTVKEDGSRPGVGKALVRWLLLIVDAQPCGLPVVGAICALTTQGHRRVGDMAAKTFVVRASAAGAPIVVPGLTAPLGSPSGYGQQDGYTAPIPGTWGSAPSPVQPTPSAEGPQWDAARGTYIQWDPSARQWLQWDDGTRTWDTIPGQ